MILFLGEVGLKSSRSKWHLSSFMKNLLIFNFRIAFKVIIISLDEHFQAVVKYKIKYDLYRV